MQELIIFITNHQLLVGGFFATLLSLLIIEFIRSRRAIYFASIPEAINMINHNHAVVIDIRPNEAYRQGHVINALSIPASELRRQPEKLDKFKDKPIILICETGVESKKLAIRFVNRNDDVYALSGGLNAWRQANFPLVKE